MRISAGIDVAKDVHWICAIDQDARVLIDRAFANTQEAVDGLVADLHRLPFGELTIGLDVMGSFAAFLQAALLAEGFCLVHVPGIAVNRARVGFAGGETKSDPRDARVIAEQVRIRPDLRTIRPDDGTTVALRLLVGRRRDLTQDQTRRLSRLHQLLASIHPGLERVLDLTTKAPLVLLTRFVTPREFAGAGRSKIIRHLRKTPGLRQPERLADVALACMAAFCAVMAGDPLSRAYYDRKRREGKRHTQALIALARRQTAVLWCMLKHRTAFDPAHRKAA